MKKVIISIILAVALIIGSVGGYYIYKKTSKKIIYDYEKGAIASKKVDGAQYTPDMDKYLEVQSTAVTAMSISTEQEFADLIDKYATIENYSGAGKYLGYDIYEIKEEIQFVVDNVPAFNQWFRMPTMREKEGYLSIPYYEWWAYYLEMNDNILSITRVCWSTRSSYLDPNDNYTVIEEHDDGSSFIQYEVMKTNYYINEDNDEVVECYLYSVGVDHVKNGVNTNTNDYYPFEYQYLKNVKDKSLIKYHITVSDREYRGAMDIRGLNPYGVKREFLIVNYDGYTNIDVTEINQKFANLANPNNSGSVGYDMESDNVKLLVKNVGVSEEDYNSSTDEKDLIDKISKQIINNFEIKNNWPSIYAESSDAIEIKQIKGPFYGQKLPISDIYVYVGCRGHYKEEIEFDAGADIYDQTLIDINKEYSLSMALRERTTGRLYIIATSYSKPEKTYYNGSDTEYYYRFTGTNLDLNASVIQDTDGVYDVTCVLTEKVGEKDKILLDTLEIGYLRQYYGLIIPDSVDNNGITHHYSCKSNGGKLTIIVTSDTVA